MLRDYLRTSAAQARHLRTPIGPYLDGYCADLERQGFARATVYSDLKLATAFGEYLRCCEKRVADLGDGHITGFVQWYGAMPRRFGPRRATPGGSVSLADSLRGSVRKLLRYLRFVGVVPPKDERPATVPHREVLDEYLQFLKVHRGFAANTIALHARSTEAFLRELGKRCTDLPLEQLTSRAVEDAHADVLAAGSGSRRAQIITSCVDVFVQYLRMSGHAPATCRPFFPRRRRYALAALPAALPRDQVEKALASIDQGSSQGRRDYAIFQMFATYGLRTSEVAGLRLDDIDWRGGSFRVRQHKTRRELHLPLVQPVADALVSYLRNGRPKDADRHVFQKVHAPHGPITRVIAYYAARKALLQAGIEAPQHGPNLLRHARATSLVRQGQPLKIIGDLLGHRVPEATAIYCKLAVEDLRAVALEVPEVIR